MFQLPSIPFCILSAGPSQDVEIRLDCAVEGSFLDFLDLDTQSQPQAVKLNGHKGVCTGRDEQGQCLVRTFENIVAAIPMPNVRSFTPGDEFDFAWPGPSAEH